MMATTQQAVTKLSNLQLRRIRQEIYNRRVHPRPRGLYTGINGESFKIPGASSRSRHFKDFTEENFVKGFNPDAWPDTIKNQPVYKKLMEYSQTDYGAAMIFRVLQDNKNKNTPRFEVRYDDGATGQKAQAGYNFILLSNDFPDSSPFKGGEKKFYLSIIHHEFGHTRFFSNNNGPTTVTLQHERLVVIHNDNPVRILNRNEPRYTYYKNGKTINIITGATSLTLHTVKDDDPTVLVKIGSPGAYR